MTPPGRRGTLFVVVLWALLVQLAGPRVVLLALLGVVCGVGTAWLVQRWREGA
jgi:hypothetical protein